MTLHHQQPHPVLISSVALNSPVRPRPVSFLTTPRPAADAFTMTVEPPTYLASLQSNIRQRPIPWGGATRDGTLTEEQQKQIEAVGRSTKAEQRKQAVQYDLNGYSSLFVGASGKKSVVEGAANTPNILQYILVLLSDLVNGKCKKSTGHWSFLRNA